MSVETVVIHCPTFCE